MSVWIELRCEESCEDHADELYTGGKNKYGLPETSRCWSHDNRGVGEMSGSANQSSVLLTYKDIVKSAKAIGWEKVKGNWVCPHCVKYRGNQDLKKVKPIVFD
ncbi:MULTISPECIES: hypothetical protein [Vibrio]|uniref:hypothetical protein n=1 Tax=Vibrio TaxID=662 RepID=UPI002075D452|nr:MULTISPECIES: hypothetical protein [Vibrio]USD35612.1 hypothetical protein J8Z27_22655 [Vibrio sp. SCSIO 43186]USD72736.1 hypothetical protein J4N41_22660 [Vibrio sp. SCSIO 43139]USD98941.1 hypothetical protein CTT30_22985 [Vibrio coralliilyticus]